MYLDNPYPSGALICQMIPQTSPQPTHPISPRLAHRILLDFTQDEIGPLQLISSHLIYWMHTP